MSCAGDSPSERYPCDPLDLLLSAAVYNGPIVHKEENDSLMHLTKLTVNYDRYQNATLECVGSARHDLEVKTQLYFMGEKRCELRQFTTTASISKWRRFTLNLTKLNEFFTVLIRSTNSDELKDVIKGVHIRFVILVTRLLLIF
jgi:hypothetical protein